jgi:hypothetical protein
MTAKSTPPDYDENEDVQADAESLHALDSSEYLSSDDELNDADHVEDASIPEAYDRDNYESDAEAYPFDADDADLVDDGDLLEAGEPDSDDVYAYSDDELERLLQNQGQTYDFIDPSLMNDYSGPLNLDIDAALAAVGSLSDELAERRANEEAEAARKAAIQQAELEYARWVENYHFDRPPMSRLKRGHPASVIPALLLMATGAYLTFALTLSETPLPPELVLLMVCGVVGITLLANWIGTGRWARGSLFAGLSLIAFGGIVYYLSLPESFIEPAQGWPLLVIGIGAAALLTAVLARPRLGVLIPIALALMLAGGVVLAANMNLLPLALGEITSVIWPFVLGVIIILLILPGLFRRQA